MSDLTDRLREAATELCTEAADEIARLRARVTELEAALIAVTGNMTMKPAEDEPDFSIQHDVPPSTPR